MRARVTAILAFSALLLGAGAARADDTPARISGFDALARSGRAVKIRARLEGKGLLGYSNVEGEFLDFFITGEPAQGRPGVQVLEKEKFIGSGKTDSNGIGEIEWTPDGTPLPVGTFEVEARIRRGSKYVAVPASLDVLAATADKPILIVSIEQTITDASWTTFMRKDAKDIAATEGAAAALTALAATHEIVYISGIEELSLTKTKDWLRTKGFPRGAVFFWNILKDPASDEKYKTQLVGRLRADFPGMTSGVGGQSDDARAYIANGLTSYLVGSTDAKAPTEAIKLKTWDRFAPAVERQAEVERVLADLATPEVAKQEAAAKVLAKLETGELGYVHRFLHASDVQLAGAARLVQGRIKARDAFSQSLDASSDQAALASLLAAWREGDQVVTARLYRDGQAGLDRGGPPLEKWKGVEIVNRNEPGPGKVVYRLRFLPEKDDAKSAEKDYAFIRGDDGVWRVDAGDL